MFKRIFTFAKPYCRTLAAIAILIVIMSLLKQVESSVSKQIIGVSGVLGVKEQGTD